MGFGFHCNVRPEGNPIKPLVQRAQRIMHGSVRVFKDLARKRHSKTEYDK